MFTILITSFFFSLQKSPYRCIDVICNSRLLTSSIILIILNTPIAWISSLNLVIVYNYYLTNNPASFRLYSVSNHVLARCDWTIQYWSRGTGGISFIDNNKTAHCFAGNDSFIRKPMITNMLKTVPGHEFDPKNLTNNEFQNINTFWMDIYSQ